MNRLLPAILVVFAIILGSMAWTTFELSKTFESEAQAREQALKTTEILYHLRRIRSSALNAETGQRGYLLSGDESYLEPYNQGKAEYQKSFDELDDILEDQMTPLQMEQLPLIKQAVTTKFTIMEKTIDLVKSGQKVAAMAVVNTDRANEIMTEMRDGIQLLIDEESELLREAIATADQRDRRAQRYLKWILSLVLAMLVIAIFLIWRAGKLVSAQAHIRDLKEANAKTELVAGELNHRIKNLFAIVLSIVRNTGRTETDVKTANDKIQNRIMALSQAHELTISRRGTEQADLQSLVQKVLEPYVSDKNTLVVSGDSVGVTADKITPLGLILHELTTNAVKYGAWIDDVTGTIQINIKRLSQDSASLTWTESGGPEIINDVTSKKGFGSRMIHLSASQLGGSIETHYRPEGLFVQLDFEL